MKAVNHHEWMVRCQRIYDAFGCADIATDGIAFILTYDQAIVMYSSMLNEAGNRLEVTGAPSNIWYIDNWIRLGIPMPTEPPETGGIWGILFGMPIVVLAKGQDIELPKRMTPDIGWRPWPVTS